MPFHRDALAFSFLMFSVIFSVWLVSGPPGFVAMHEWQTLMASVVALGAATMAFKAAMAKVEFDREVHQRNEIRSTLGLCLRLSFALKVLRHEATLLRNSIPKDSNITMGKEPKLVQAAWFQMGEPDALLEAWKNLEKFPPWIAAGLSKIRGSLYDMATYKDIFGQTLWDIKFGEATPPELIRVRLTAEDLSDTTQAVWADLEKLIDGLRER